MGAGGGTGETSREVRELLLVKERSGTESGTKLESEEDDRAEL